MTSLVVNFSASDANTQDKTMIFFAFRGKISNHESYKPFINPLYDLDQPGIYPAHLPEHPQQKALIISLGNDETLSSHKIEDQGGSLAQWAIKHKLSSLSVFLNDELNVTSFTHHFTLGFVLGNYQYNMYRTIKPMFEVSELHMVHADHSTLNDLWLTKTKPLCDGILLARDLVSAPANELNPESYAEALKTLSEDGLKVTILNEETLHDLGLNALVGVGQGSSFQSSLAIIEWGTQDSDEPPLALVGKGVTFDSGGISLKPGKGMWDMKFDMGGSASVAGAMKAIAGLKCTQPVVGIIALVENMPSSLAQRPSDVVTSYSGQTIEIQNTDAEGRLILADALTYVQKHHKPKAIVDLATLTGAIIVGLGHENAGLFCNNDVFTQQLKHCSQATREPIWSMPLSAEYDKLIDSDIADMKNIGGPGAGSITAAQFLQRFIENDLPWAHLDIAGTAWLNKSKPITPKGATGFGVRLLTELATKPLVLH